MGMTNLDIEKFLVELQILKAQVAVILGIVPLLDDSMADALHRHSELSASDGTPNPAVSVDEAGNVGIGTASPAVALHAYGTGQRMRIENSGSGGAFLEFTTNEGGGSSRVGYVGDGGLNHLTLGSDTGTIILTGGNVGIGTTSPDGTLHVHTGSAGAVTADVTADDLVVESNAAGGGMSILTDDSRDTNLFFGTKSDNSGVIQRWEYHADLFSIGTAKTDAELRLLTGNFVEALRIDSTGNVGIGTTSPDTLLDLESTVPYLTIHNNTHEDADGGRESRISFKGEQSGEELTTLARIEVSHDGASDDEKGKMVFSTNALSDTDTPTERFRISAAGGVSTVNRAITLANGATTFAVTSNVMTITGDGGGNTVATIAGAESGTLLTLIFVDANITITDTDAHTADTVDLAGSATDFTSADDTTLQLVYDGTSWYETGRSVN